MKLIPPWRYRITFLWRWRAIALKPRRSNSAPISLGSGAAYSTNSKPSVPAGLSQTSGMPLLYTLLPLRFLPVEVIRDPGEGQQDHEQKCIRRDLQVEVHGAMDADGHHAHQHAERKAAHERIAPARERLNRQDECHHRQASD